LEADVSEVQEGSEGMMGKATEIFIACRACGGDLTHEVCDDGSIYIDPCPACVDRNEREDFKRGFDDGYGQRKDDEAW